MQIIKRNGTTEEANPQKIKNAINAAFKAKSYSIEDDLLNLIVKDVSLWDNITIEDIQDEVVEVLRKGYKIGDKLIRHAMVKVAN